MLRGINRWLEENLWAGDAVIATGLLAVAALVHASNRDLYGLLMSVLLILPLYARRSRPKPVLIVVALLCLLQLAVLAEPVFGDVAAPLVVHAATAHIRDRRWGAAALLMALIGAVLGALRWEQQWIGSGQFVLLAGAGAATVIAAYLLGARQRDRGERVEEQVTALEERNRLLAIERDQRTEMAAAAERARIARELHDIVAHSLSVIVVQADGGAAAVTAAPGSAGELAPKVLGIIADTSREALGEMRRMVAVLRSGSLHPGERGSSDATFTPAPGVRDIPALTAQVTRAGVPVTFTENGVRRLSSTIDLTVYRVVQESLTNVLKHAGPAARAEVDVAYRESAVEVTVTDDGRGTASSFDTAAFGADGFGTDGFGADGFGTSAFETSGGHGLLGMRERVLLHGGSLRAGQRRGGGFVVRASIPLHESTAPAGPPDSSQQISGMPAHSDNGGTA